MGAFEWEFVGWELLKGVVDGSFEGVVDGSFGGSF